jgi:hypothetical protein
MTYYTSIG